MHVFDVSRPAFRKSRMVEFDPKLKSRMAVVPVETSIRVAETQTYWHWKF